MLGPGLGCGMLVPSVLSTIAVSLASECFFSCCWGKKILVCKYVGRGLHWELTA